MTSFEAIRKNKLISSGGKRRNGKFLLGSRSNSMLIFTIRILLLQSTS